MLLCKSREKIVAILFVYTDLVEDELGRVYIFEAHEGVLACNDPAFLKLGGCGVAVHAVSPQLLEGLRASERTARACVLPVDTYCSHSSEMIEISLVISRASFPTTGSFSGQAFKCFVLAVRCMMNSRF